MTSRTAISEYSYVTVHWQQLLTFCERHHSIFLKKRKFVMRTPSSSQKRHALDEDIEISPPSGGIRRSETREHLMERIELLETENARVTAENAKLKREQVLRDARACGLPRLPLPH